MKQHAQPQHKPGAQSRDQRKEQKGKEQKGTPKAKTDEQAGSAAKERTESDRAERTSMQHGTDQSAKRPMQVPSEDGRAAAQEGQLPQNQQRLGQHQNSRKQP
ncbi:hypothetical protein [Ralstonia soli]|uniref:Uncharacterized protein n=1 Tax=Ralstonia soli TaxID=2953896 RepID=A0ABT1ATL6_9RALS|nr:hypothetical protein [Ralstonia soli]MCO5401561.1 hypothetical protein [Ralstonia soli]